jgi:hypothetical protein
VAWRGWAKWVGLVEGKWCVVVGGVGSNGVSWGKCVGLVEGAQRAARPVLSGGVVSYCVVRPDGLSSSGKAAWCGVAWPAWPGMKE